MARIPMVTRTIAKVEVTSLCLDTATAEPQNAKLVIPSTINYEDEKKVLKFINAKFEELEDCNLVATKVVNVEVTEKLYGMTEEEFIAHAKELPPRGTETAETN